MAEFEPGSSGVGSDRSANCATTTALRTYILKCFQNMFVTLTKSQNIFSTIDFIGTVIQLNWLQNGFQER